MQLLYALPTVLLLSSCLPCKNSLTNNASFRNVDPRMNSNIPSQNPRQNSNSPTIQEREGPRTSLSRRLLLAGASKRWRSNTSLDVFVVYVYHKTNLLGEKHPDLLTLPTTVQVLEETSRSSYSSSIFYFGFANYALPTVQFVITTHYTVSAQELQ